jgi:hypothetical protein
MKRRSGERGGIRYSLEVIIGILNAYDPIVEPVCVCVQAGRP